MPRFAKIGMLLAVLLCASGCSTYSLQELRQTTPSGNAFQKALTKRYLEFAQIDEERYDWFNSMHFADKGLLAAYGQEIGPEELDGWNIKPDAKAELEVARSELLAALTPQAIENQAELAADAQFNFDCWVQYQEAGWQQERIDECRDNFHAALSQLKGAHVAGKAGAPDTSAYIVYFAWGQATVTREGQRVIDEVVQEVKPEGTYEITLNGHTDTTGRQEYNLRLSERRAEAVKKRLIDGGVSAVAIKIFAFGESDPAVATADDANEPLNRRVEIFLDENKRK